MLRLGYPARIDRSFLSVFQPDVECVPLDDGIEGTVDLDVWLPDPLPTRAQRIWPHLRGVRLVLSLMAGTEWMPSVLGPQVTICKAHGAHNIATAEWTLSAILTVLKHIPLFFNIQQSGDWRRRREASAEYEAMHPGAIPLYPPVMLEELTGKRVLMVGYGAIGKEIERMLSPFNVEMTRVARTARQNPTVYAVDELDALIPAAEIIILILPLTDQSRGLIGPRQFELMQQGTLLVNAARGPVVQTDALVAALNSGKIRAALDVTDPEPLPEDHPLWRCPNVFITPHIAGSSPQFAPRALQVAADELRRYRAGEPLHNAVQIGIESK